MYSTIDRSRFKAFLTYREERVCEDSFTGRGLLMQKNYFPGEVNTLIGNALFKRMKETCPEVFDDFFLDMTVGRYRDFQIDPARSQAGR